MAGEREITIRIVGDASKAKQTFTDVGTAAGTFEGKISGLNTKWSTFAGTMGGVVAGGALQSVAGFLKDGATGAAEDAAAMGRLQTAVENTGASFGDHKGKIDDAIKAGQDLAFSDGEVMSALTNLTSATGDTDEALRRLTLAQDLSRGTGMSLEQASKLLGKTSDENTATLARYGIQLGENATAQDVMNEVDKRFGGQAAAFAESDAGKWAQLQLQMGELQETIGGMLIPAFTFLATAFSTVMTALEPVTSFIEANIKPIMIGLAAAITVVVIPAFVAWALAAGAAALATVVAMAPVLAVAAAVGLVVAALYLAWNTNFLGIRDITQQVIDFVGPYITTAIGAIKTLFETVWPLISAAVDIAMQAISLYVTTYIAAVQTVIETVLPIIQGVFETVWPIVSAVVETAMGVVGTVVGTQIEIARSAIDTALGLIRTAFETVWPAVQLAVETAMTAVTTATDKISDIYTTINDTLSDIKQAFTDAWDDIVTTVSDAVDDAVTAVTDVASDMYDAGADLVQSLIDGVADKLQALRDIVSDIGDIIGSIDVPGFSPPDEAGWEIGYGYGAQMGLGIAAGWNATGVPALSGISGDLGAPVTGSVSGDLPMPGSPGGSPGAGSGGVAPGGGGNNYGATGGGYVNPLYGLGNIGSGGVGNSGMAKISIAPADMGTLADTIARAVEAAVERGIRRALAGAI